MAENPVAPVTPGDIFSSSNNTFNAGTTQTVNGSLALTNSSSLVLRPNYTLFCRTFAAYGSSDTKIPRASITYTNTGEGICWNYVTNAANGTQITLLQSGWYSAYMSIQNPVSTQTEPGWSLNASGAQLTMNIEDVVTNNPAVGLGFEFNAPGSGNANQPTCTVIFYGTSNDVLRPHTTGQTPSASYQFHYRVTKF